MINYIINIKFFYICISKASAKDNEKNGVFWYPTTFDRQSYSYFKAGRKTYLPILDAKYEIEETKL